MDMPTELLSRIFQITELFDRFTKKYIFDFCLFVVKTGIYLIEPIKINQY